MVAQGAGLVAEASAHTAHGTGSVPQQVLLRADVSAHSCRGGTSIIAVLVLRLALILPQNAVPSGHPGSAGGWHRELCALLTHFLALLGVTQCTEKGTVLLLFHSSCPGLLPFALGPSSIQPSFSPVSGGS